WLPHRFSSLSDRLTMQNGIILISMAAVLTLYLTGGHTSTLILMYSINVFLTFSLSQTSMVKFWIQNRKKFLDWFRNTAIHSVALVLCLSILVMNFVDKFAEGAWVTSLVTATVIGLCLLIKHRYNLSTLHLSRLDTILTTIPTTPVTGTPPNLDPKAPSAVFLVSSYGGLGIHTFLTVLRLFPNHFKNFIFASVTVFDAGNFKGAADVDGALEQTRSSLLRYVDFARRLGLAADYRTAVGTEVLDEAEKLGSSIAAEYPNSVFFAGKLVFQKERWYHRLLHNETAVQFQRRAQFAGLNSMVLPIRVFVESKSNANAS
ncbi:MAG TPA: amino acid transporter, partial [Bacteroidota bacterium]